jgi:hypothetical protein
MYDIRVGAHFENNLSVEIDPKPLEGKYTFFALVLQMVDVTVLYKKDIARAWKFSLEK